jgi:hypothetical protein
MAVQTSLEVTNVAFILHGQPLRKDNETVSQDAGRGSADMVAYTIMSYNPTSQEWVPFTDETASDGTQYPRGILMQTLDAADIVAGDVVDVPILVGGTVICDVEQITIENSKTLDTIINVPAGFNTSVRDFLQMNGIFFEDTVDIDEFEN